MGHSLVGNLQGGASVHASGGGNVARVVDAPNDGCQDPCDSIADPPSSMHKDGNTSSLSDFHRHDKTLILEHFNVDIWGREVESFLDKTKAHLVCV